MGDPKAVFALDDGNCIVLADSFDQKSQNYKGIIFFQINSNGKTERRKQLFKLDTNYEEQRLEKVIEIDDELFFRWYFTFYNRDSIKTSKSYLSKIDLNGNVNNNVSTEINYFGQYGVYWNVLNKDTLINLDLNSTKRLVKYTSISTGKTIDSFLNKPVGPIWIEKNKIFFAERKRFDKNGYYSFDSIFIRQYDFNYNYVKTITIKSSKQIEIFGALKRNKECWFFEIEKNQILKTDSDLTQIWQTPSEFVEANIEPAIKDIRILKNDDVLVIADAHNLFTRVPYFSRISADGKTNYFKYSYPSPLDRYYDFDEGSNGEFYFLSGSRLSQKADSIWIIKTNRFGNTSSMDVFKSDNRAIKIYPNPSNGISTIEIKNFSNNRVTYEIYTLSGQQVQNGNLVLNDNGIGNIDYQTLPKGIYLINVNANGQEQQLKLFKE
ncbi:MAG: T9SS type A sorting domain-containing protein [Bacteroidia bacterium]